MRLRSLLAVAVAATVAITAGAVSAAPSGSDAVPRCRTSGLVAWLDTSPGGAAAGSTYYRLKFTNLSGHECTLAGYPGVSAVDLAGRQLGSAASRDPARRPRLVTLAAGGTATAVLQIANARNFPEATCRPKTAAGLRVYPPNATASKRVPFPFLACSRAGPVYLTIQALRRG